MSLSERSDVEFARGYDGQLLPAEAIVVNPPCGGDYYVWVLPMTIGELAEMKVSSILPEGRDYSPETLVKEHIYFNQGGLTKEEIDWIKEDWLICLFKTLMYHSGLSLEEIGEEKTEDKRFLRKKTKYQKDITNKIKKEDNWIKLLDFLHEKGMPYFDIPRLTNSEVKNLIAGHNARNEAPTK